MGQIIEKLQPVSEKKQEKVDHKIIDKITCGDEHHRKLEIFRKGKLPETTAQISDVHKEQRISAKNLCIKDIDQCTAQKADIHTFLLSSHKSEGSGHDNEQIRRNRQK